MRPVIGILTLTGLVALNVQIFLLAEHINLAPERMASSISSLVVAQSQPEEIQRKLEELERLRASNAALQAVVSSLSSAPSVGVERQAAPAAAPSGVSADFSFFPVLPLPGQSSPPPRVVADTSIQEEASAESPAEEAKPEGEDKAKAPPAGRLLVTPIRTRENGALVYLALDKVVRVVEVNGRLHGVDGYYEGVDEGLANLVIKGKRISLPLLVSGT